jgi:gliding motility-associated-like protein
MAHPTGGTLPYTFTWTPALFNDSIVQYLPDGYYRLTLTDFSGCVDTASASVSIGDCDPELPTAFSPNGDGKNDSYVIHGLSKFPQNSFKVFNRWGNEVFAVKNYSNVEWYGQNSHGENLPDGTYYVVFEAMNGSLSLYNYVDLRR